MRVNARRQLDEVRREYELALQQAEDAAENAFRLGLALEAMPQAVTICDERGEVAFRNRHAEALVGARHSDAVAARAVESLLRDVSGSEPRSQTLELHGPPPRTLVLTGTAIRHGDQPVG